MLRNQDQDELNQILSQTYTSSNYVDEQIKHLIEPTQEEVPLKKIESNEISAGRSSQSSQPSHFRQEPSFGSIPQRSSLLNSPEGPQSIYDQKLLPPSQESKHIFDECYQTINKHLKAHSIQQVRQHYPLFLLSQPQYEITNNIKQLSIGYPAGVLRKNVVVMDCGYCQQQKMYKVAVGTDEGQVIIFEPNASKPQHIIQCGDTNISCVRWSKNLQYLAISTDSPQLFVYAFKQSITIQTYVSYRILKTPNEYLSLGNKQLKNMVVEVYFVQEMPLQILAVDEHNKISKVTMRKNYVHLRPFVEEFKHPISDFLDLSFLTTFDEHKKKGIFMAASGHELVTLSLIEPMNQLAMVYDKDKHGGQIKKKGYPHVSFRQHPAALMVVWDRYLQIVNIQVKTFYPPNYSFTIAHRYLLPDSTITAGFLSNSLLYQVTPLGIKLYSSTTFEQELTNHHNAKEILFHRLNYDDFIFGQRIQQAVSAHNIDMADLRYIKGLFSTANRTILFCTKNGLNMIYLTTLQQHIMVLVENNYWKIALEILKDCHKGQIYELDQIHPEMMQSKIKELTMRYINFLETVVLSDKEQGNNTMPLWNQELSFIFNIVLTAGLQTFLLDQIIPKIFKINPAYLSNLIPFILTNKLTQLTSSSLTLLLSALPKMIVSKLIFNLQPLNNDPELPHQINNQLIQHELYLELIDLNQKFRDHYTSTAVLVGLYLKLEMDNDSNIMTLTDLKRKIGFLLAYSFFDTLTSINFNKYSKSQNKQILTVLLPLLTEQIFSILIRQEATALFQNILEELYLGTCLQTLNQLQDGTMLFIIRSIPYAEVVQFKSEKKYWLAIMRLYARRIIHLDIYRGLYYLCVEDHIQKNYLEKFVNKCQEMIVEQLKTIREDELNSFFEELVSTPQQQENLFSICLVKTVGRILGRHVDVLDNMFREPTERNVTIFQYLDFCLPLLSALELSMLKSLLKHNIQLLTDIDSSQTSDIICKHYLSDLNLFIHDLDNYPNQQLKLIQAVLQLYSYQESLLDLKVKYLQLLAITNKHDRILSELMKQNYPLDQSIEICKRYDVLEAYAYLLVKSGGSGNIEAAIKVYFNIIWQKIVKTVLSPHQPQQFNDIVMHYVSQCIHICIELDLQDHQFQWFSIMEQLQLLKRNIFKNLVIDGHTCQTLKNIINKHAYPQLVKILIKEVSYFNVINYLSLKLTQFDLQAIDIVIGQMVKNYLYERGMHKILQDSFIDTETTLRNKLFKKQLMGFATDDVCDFCMQKGGVLIHYRCGHEIHPACGQDVRECFLCMNQTAVIYQKRIDSLLKIKPEIYSSGLIQNLQDVEEQIKREGKLQKMALYEQMTRVDLQSYDG